MILRPILLNIALFSSGIAGFSQSLTESSPLQLTAKFYPLSLADPNFPCIQTGVELRKNKLSMLLNWGLNYNFYTLSDSEKRAYKIHGNKFRLELRKNRNNKKADLDYLGIGIFYTGYTRGMDRFNYRDKASGRNFHFEQGVINKKVLGLLFKTGKAFPIGDGFFIEVSPEIGIRLVNTAFTDTIDLEETGYAPRNFIDPESAVQGRRVKPHIAMPVSLNYRF